MRIGDKIIRYSIVSNRTSSLETFEITSIHDNVIVLSNQQVLYAKTLKPRHDMYKLGLSQAEVRKQSRSRIYYRYKEYSKETWDELRSREG